MPRRRGRRATAADTTSGSRISEFLWSLTPRTLARSAMAAAVAILVQAAVIASVVVKEQRSPSGPELASAPNEGSYAVVRFAPQATANDITNFLRAYKTKVVDGPLNTGSSLYRIQLSETKLPKEEVGKIIRQMQSESKIVDFIAAVSPSLEIASTLPRGTRQFDRIGAVEHPHRCSATLILPSPSLAPARSDHRPNLPPSSHAQGLAHTAHRRGHDEQTFAVAIR
jgi:hypothetical protein